MDNSILRIYHGSENIIEAPVYGKGSLRNDYGRGFYCTSNVELAKEWACSRGSDGYANAYDLNMTELSVLRLNEPPYHILNWLAVLAENRTYWEKNSISENAKQYLRDNFLVDISSYDIIIGYRADDSYFTFAKNFVANAISLQQLSKAMKLGKLGEQIVLKSEAAFSQIHFVNAASSEAGIYYYQKTARDRQAQREYRDSVRNSPNKNDLFMLDIMREGMKNGDARLL